MSLLDIYKEHGHKTPESSVFTTLEELPVDDHDFIKYPDGDDANLSGFQFLGGIDVTDVQRAESAMKNSSASLLKAINKKSYVPLPRNLFYKKINMRGQDVLALQRALAAAKFRKWGNFTGVFGLGTEKNIKDFQKSLYIKQDGIYDKNVHAKLAPYYDQYGAFLMNKVNKKLNQSPRSMIVAYAMFGYANRYKIHYTQSSLRMYGVRNKIRPPKIPYYEDCSSFATWCYWGAGVPDPNGLGYNGWGYTGTLCEHGRPTIDPQPGDLAFYGNGKPYHHVTVYVGNGNCVSHGSEIGPTYLPVRYRSDFSHFRTYIK